MKINLSAAKLSLEETSLALSSLNESLLEQLAELLISLSDSQNTLWTMGNGGSSSTASHMACDINKGVSMTFANPIRCISINELAATQSAWGNDFGFDNALKNQFAQLAVDGDALLCISGSGNSANIVEAAKYAKSRGIKVVTLVGKNGGLVSAYADIDIRVDSTDMQVLENVHLAIVHWLYKALAQ